MAYEKKRLPMTAEIVRSNRRGGPEGVIDAVEHQTGHVGVTVVEAIGRLTGERRTQIQEPLVLAVPLDPALLVLGERGDERADLVAERVADVVDRARRVLDDVVQQSRELRGLVGAGVAEDVGHGLCVGQPLPGAHARAVIGIEQEADRSRPRGETLGDSGRHARH